MDRSITLHDFISLIIIQIVNVFFVFFLFQVSENSNYINGSTTHNKDDIRKRPHGHDNTAHIRHKLQSLKIGNVNQNYLIVGR